MTASEKKEAYLAPEAIPVVIVEALPATEQKARTARLQKVADGLKRPDAIRLVELREAVALAHDKGPR